MSFGSVFAESMLTLANQPTNEEVEEVTLPVQDFAPTPSPENIDSVAEENSADTQTQPTQSFVARKDISNNIDTEGSVDELKAKAKTNKEKKALYEKRCKRSKTIFKKTERILEVFPEAITLIRTQAGCWLMEGSSALESALKEGRPLVDISRNSVMKYKKPSGVDGDLSFEDNIPPALVSSPMKLPPAIQQSVPGGSKTMTIVQEFEGNRPSTSTHVPNRAPKAKRKREAVAGKKFQEKKKVKRVQRKKTTVVKPLSVMFSPRSGDDSGDDCPTGTVCTFKDCWAIYKDAMGWIKCDVCKNWACPKCSKTEFLSKKIVNKIKLKCDKCRL